MCKCKDCNVDLVVHDNWTISFKQRNYYRCKPCQNKYNRDYRKQNPDRDRNNMLKRKYNMTISDYNKMYDEQNGECNICNKPSNNLHVDHCHTTGKVRGLLCVNCNQLLGKAFDNPDILNQAIDYLKNNVHYSVDA